LCQVKATFLAPRIVLFVAHEAAAPAWRHQTDHVAPRVLRRAEFEFQAARPIAAGSFPAAQTVFELGCGTGRLAENLLAHHLPADARYLGADISDTMAALSRVRLRRFGARAQVVRADGTVPLPAASGEFDRFVSVYVFDLLSPHDASAALAEACRPLRPGGAALSRRSAKSGQQSDDTR
jgi:ubiquinone/menaquinone biosynthesis C-methylase UbiE